MHPILIRQIAQLLLREAILIQLEPQATLTVWRALITQIQMQLILVSVWPAVQARSQDQLAFQLAKVVLLDIIQILVLLNARFVLLVIILLGLPQIALDVRQGPMELYKELPQ